MSEKHLPGGTVCLLKVNNLYTYRMAVLLHLQVLDRFEIQAISLQFGLLLKKKMSEVEDGNDYITCSCCLISLPDVSD